ncbi:Alpha/Beta hydrolase protein [Lineolata rhizophorae]|uniref:Alpha/Beta hydrolase protein n=1 Tax=Lineolata rhizophorae TaxID=578093 RepID=A0A6A6P1Q2_9PEZI|nr:Alpha/Beta hydrolase protein [Lineolata rhizophorae]
MYPASTITARPLPDIASYGLLTSPDFSPPTLSCTTTTSPLSSTLRRYSNCRPRTASSVIFSPNSPLSLYKSASPFGSSRPPAGHAAHDTRHTTPAAPPQHGRLARAATIRPLALILYFISFFLTLFTGAPLLLRRATSMASRPPRPRWVLHVQAQVWRFLMEIGMFLHRLAPPRPPSPAFTRTVPVTISPRKGQFTIQFYVPSDYEAQTRLRSRSYPVVVNFHGGGFTLGKATDDARWCATVVEQVGAVVANVNYRLAPENPFPTAVEDGCDAVIYVAQHAHELNIDPDRIALSGFSSGASMCFTVPLRLAEELLPMEELNGKDDDEDFSETSNVSAQSSRRTLLKGASPDERPRVKVSRELKIRTVVSWYPSTDYTQTREQRRMTNPRVDQQLPAVFTDLFDESYLQPPTLDMSDPLLSPGVAPADLLAAGLPDKIVLYTCEWDMLLAEGIRFRDRLRNEAGKDVEYTMVPGAPHAWDKAPNPLRVTPGVQEHYARACTELKKALSKS